MGMDGLTVVTTLRYEGEHWSRLAEAPCRCGDSALRKLKRSRL
jgi:hypothetical protein